MPKFELSKRTKSIWIGLVCGALSALCVGFYISSVDAQAQAAQSEMLAKYGGDQIDVCVAKRDIAAGQTVSDGDVEMRTWIATLLPADAVIDKKDVVGKKVGSTILAGEVVSAARFGFESSDIEVPDGLVAVSVPSREVQAIGGALGAGMTTDVYAVGPDSTERLAASVPVLATSMSSDAKTSGASAWVTLAVKPQMVQELVTAAEHLEIYFTLPSSGALEGDSPDGSEVLSDSDAKNDIGGGSGGGGSESSSRSAEAGGASDSERGEA